MLYKNVEITFFLYLGSHIVIAICIQIYMSLQITVTTDIFGETTTSSLDECLRYFSSRNAVIPKSTKSCVTELAPPPPPIKVVNQPRLTRCLDRVCLMDNSMF